MTQLTKVDFDAGVRSGQISDPEIETFGDGRYDPYVEDRRAFGNRGVDRVWAWVRGPKSREPIVVAD